jgi:hypothetical protein
VQQPAQNREALIVRERPTGGRPVIPRDVEPACDTGALEPREEWPYATPDHRASRDPLVDEVLTQAGELELLSITPKCGEACASRRPSRRSIQQAADPAIDAASLEQRARLSFAEGNGMNAEDPLQESQRIRTQSRRPRSALAAKDAATVTVG